jgi:cation diffusion facilitator CzcD-associated flavoprotein CzcO
VRSAVFWGREAYILPFKKRRFRRYPKKMALAHLAEQVPDPELQRKLTPDYEVGCKRILLSNEYFPALQQPNVELVTEGVVEVRPHGVVTADGREHDVDTIVWGTGFRVSDMPAGEHIRGRDGRLLGDVWRQGGLQALRGTTIAGFPNLFMLLGPHTGLGHTSVVLMIESQIEYVLGALRAMNEQRIEALEPLPAAQAAFVAGVRRRARGTVWESGGCASWYLDAGGHSVLWPDSARRFRRALRDFDLTSYLARPYSSSSR